MGMACLSRWEFITNDHDISFGWYQKSGAKRRRFLLPTTEMSEVVWSGGGGGMTTQWCHNLFLLRFQ